MAEVTSQPVPLLQHQIVVVVAAAGRGASPPRRFRSEPEAGRETRGSQTEMQLVGLSRVGMYTPAARTQRQRNGENNTVATS